MNDNLTKLVGLAAVAAIVIGGVLWISSSDDDSDDTAQTNTSQTSEASETTDASEASTDASEAEEASTIVDLAVATESLSTLVTAVTAADLAETLSGEGPFTVLAPTNDAFAALPHSTLDNLLLEENKADLVDVLTYHVIAGDVMSTDLSDGMVVETLQGGELTVKINDSGVFFMDAAGNMSQVVSADIEASNGVVHVIDGVLLQ